jgi:hypothetical protein
MTTSPAHVTSEPLVEKLLAPFRRFAATADGIVLRGRQSAIGDAWVFPAPDDRSRSCSRHLMRDWWERAVASRGDVRRWL